MSLQAIDAIEAQQSGAFRAHAAVPGPELALSMCGVAKSFGTVAALAGVDLHVNAGEVLAIVGGNGAGKSTLISIATGALAADSGVVKVGETVIDAADPCLMRSMGVAAAYQHPALVADLTVKENLLLANSGASQVDIDRFEALLRRLAGDANTIALDADVADLDIIQQHVVEISRAVMFGTRGLILDEPTEPFHDAQVDTLFQIIAELKSEGVAVIYISHRLHEVFRVADRIAVIRDGRLVETRHAREFSSAELVSIIGGRPVGALYPVKQVLPLHPSPLLHVHHEDGRGASFDFVVGRGEIVGLAGIEGQGQRTFMRSLAGLAPLKGRIEISGQEVRNPALGHLRGLGIRFLSDDRHKEGLFLALSITENLGLGADDLEHGWRFVDRGRHLSIANTARSDFCIRAPSVEVAVKDLSGGNQQKVALARELNAKPLVLLADEPTKGVDVAARADIYAMLRSHAESGNAVVVLSSDAQELAGLCDRVVTFSQDSICAELAGSEVSQQNILRTSLQAKITRAEIAAGRDRRSGTALRRFVPTGLLLAAIVAIAAGVAVVNPLFLAKSNLTSMLTFAAILGCLAASQLAIVLLGSADLSLGPLAGLVVVVASFVMTDTASAGSLGAWALVIVVGCALFALGQALFVLAAGAETLLVTLATFVGLQGLSLTLRPIPAGEISSDLHAMLTHGALGVPAVFLLALGLVIGLELVNWRTPFGRSVRAIGADATSAMRYGVRRPMVVATISAVAGGLTGLAGIFLAAEIGIGSANVGVDYTLLSLAAVALGGAKISGGFGSYVNSFLGACFLQLAYTATSFLGFGSDVQFWTVGLSVLLAATIFRSSGTRAH